MKHIYVTLVDVRPLSGCEIDPEEYNGASVRCYVAASGEKEARTLLKRSFDASRFELMNEEFFVREDLVEWEHPESEEASEAIKEAKESNDVVYSEFRAWGHDDPDAWNRS